MKTIVQVVGPMNRGGAEVMLMDLLRKLHHDFHFIVLVNRHKGKNSEGDFDEELRKLEVPIHYIDSVWDVGISEYKRQFQTFVSSIGQIDIIHSHLNSKGGIIAKCAAQCGIKRRIVHSHAKIKFNGSLPSIIFHQAELRLQRLWINKYATDYWGCSFEALKSLFSPSHCASNRAQVIHNAIDADLFIKYNGRSIRDELDIPADIPIIGTVGRIATVKNYEFVADIIMGLWRKGIEFHYVVAGRRQDEKSFQYLLETLGEDPRFHYLGMRSDLPAVYHGLDLYLGASRREGLGLTAVEAQACGVRCILSSGFPRQCDLNANLVTFMESFDAENWINRIPLILRAEKTSHQNLHYYLQKAGYDIDLESQRVKKLYLDD